MIKVVVMDNSGLSRDLLKSLLTNGGHEIVGDSNINPANVARVVKMAPQMICIDLGEDLQAGRMILEELRSALPKTMLFLVSGKMSQEGIKLALEYGVHGFIVKPFNSATVLATIRNAVLKLIKQQQQAKIAESE